MEKFCVFCGKQHEKKNKEHIIPRWLIKYTGDPKRRISLGVNWGGTKPHMMSFPFDCFTLPACTECNNSHATLEGNAKVVMMKIFSNGSINKQDINILLNWFDKVRVGLWLADYYLNKNYMGITPKFQIERRIAAFDRCLLIYRSTDCIDGLNYFGPGIPAFQYVPSCFHLRIKDVWFFNISSSYLFSRRLGFPFPEEIFWSEDLKNFTIKNLAPARERIMLPIIQWPYDINCVEIYQPVFSQKLIRGDSEEFVKIYDAPYVTDNTLDYESGLGGIFLKDPNRQINKIEGDIQLNIPQRYDRYELREIFTRQNLDFFTKLFKMPSAYYVKKDSQREVKRLTNYIVSSNRAMLSIFLKENGNQKNH